jgi:hypothetical protein
VGVDLYVNNRGGSLSWGGGCLSPREPCNRSGGFSGLARRRGSFVAGIGRASPLDLQHMHLLFGHPSVLDSFGDNVLFARSERDGATTPPLARTHCLVVLRTLNSCEGAPFAG